MKTPLKKVVLLAMLMLILSCAVVACDKQENADKWLEFSFDEKSKGYTIVNCAKAVEDIVLPDEYNGYPVTGIKSYAFDGCNRLKSVTIPDSITSIGLSAFRGCGELSVISVDSENPIYRSVDNCLINTQTKELILGCATSIIPTDGSVESICDSAFFNSPIENIVIPDSVKVIGAYAFFGCSALNDVVIGRSVENIENSVFAYCTSLTEIILPDSVKTIGTRAFEYCSALQSITIANGVTRIGDLAFLSCGELTDVNWNAINCAYAGKTTYPIFSDCRNLSQVNFGEDVMSIPYYAFKNTNWYTKWYADQPDGIVYMGNIAYTYKGYATENTTIQLRNGTTVIESGLFSNQRNIVDITIPNSVKVIGKSAFALCSGLNSITIPDSVTTIGESAFNMCYNLSSVTLGNGLTRIENGLFANCSKLTNIVIPDSVTNIGKNAFLECRSLESVTIPSNMVGIGDFAFKNCSKLKDVHIFDLSKWCRVNFESATSNPLYYATELYLAEEKIVDLVIPNDVDSISKFAFCNFEGIGKITIPNSVVSIADNSFSDCPNLHIIDVAPDNKNYTSNGNCIIEKSTKKLILGCRFTIIPTDNSVTSIGNGAFRNCVGLSNIDIPESVVSIGSDAFSYCAELNKVSIGTNIANIGANAFHGCENLREVHTKDLTKWCAIQFENAESNPLSCGGSLYVDGELLTELVVDFDGKISNFAFYNCDSLVSVTLSAKETGNNKFTGITSIGNGAFSKCSSLTDITFSHLVTNIGSEAFAYCTNLTNVSMLTREEKKDKLTIIKGVKIIGDGAFRNCYSISSIIMPDSVMTIANSAFYECRGLTDLTIGNAVTYIGDSAFRSCDRLISATIPDSVSSIGKSAFYECRALTNLTIGSALSNIGEGAFFECDNLSRIVVSEENQKYHSASNCLIETNEKTLIFGCKNSIIPIDKSVEIIGEKAFYNCRGLTNISIPYGVTCISNYAFYGCENLNALTIPNGVTRIGLEAFGNCGSLTKISIPNSVMHIGKGAFDNCNSLTDLELSNSIKSIEDLAFYWCTALTGVVIPGGVESIRLGAFAECLNLTTITIPNSVKSIDSLAFFACRSLSSITFNGTKEQWLTIEKGDYWNYNTPDFVIHCIDGDLDKDGNEI